MRPPGILAAARPRQVSSGDRSVLRGQGCTTDVRWCNPGGHHSAPPAGRVAVAIAHLVIYLSCWKGRPYVMVGSVVDFGACAVILTGPTMEELVLRGELTIDPFDTANLNPNSYNIHLADQISVASPAGTGRHASYRKIPQTGFHLKPKTVYLGSTVERFGAAHLVPCLISRSSVARLGLFVQLNADLGNLGAIHCWTLELFAVQPILLYPGMAVAQVMFWRPTGQITLYQGAYALYNMPQHCRYTPESMVNMNLSDGRDDSYR